ncbi:LysE family transporter [Pelagibacteraceae bacterium]|nr:LysE family transporter [Pelagibacteraceae bacterium]
MYIYDFIQGLIIGGTLIIAIGPQNLFVIQQGLKKSSVFTVTLFCSLSDSLLIVIGIYLSNYIVQINPSIIGTIKVLGGIWREEIRDNIFYGLNKVIKLNQIKDINIELNIINEYGKVLITLFLITYANPHVYLDTIILLGSLSTNFNDQFSFGVGAISASFLFFFSLGYMSKFLSKYIYSNKTWFWIDLTIGLLMISYGIYFIIF